MNIKYDVLLQPLNTFGVEVKASALVVVNNDNDLEDALFHACGFEETFILGGGSNVLFTRDIDGLVLYITRRGIRIVEETETHVVLDIEAGERWDDIVRFCVNKNWGGIENLSLIPGTAGAAPIQNIGAYGVELSQVLLAVYGIHRQTGQRCEWDTAACTFGYRQSIFKSELRNSVVITTIRLQLKKNPGMENLNVSYGVIQEQLKTIKKPWTIADVSNTIRMIRRNKLPDPAVLGNAGSFFKNPELPTQKVELLREKFPQMPVFAGISPDYRKISAGWMIEQCGWKGEQSGRVGMHKDQALVLVNYGGATGLELLHHATLVQDSVEETFGIRLEPEVNIIR